MEPDDETIQALEEGIAARKAQIAKLDRLIEQVERPTSSFKTEAEPSEKLAAAEALVETVLTDPESSQEERKRAMVKLDRAKLVAEAEAKQSATFGAMARSLDLRARESSARDAADRACQVHRDAADKEAEETKWGHARRRKYVGGGF